MVRASNVASGVDKALLKYSIPSVYIRISNMGYAYIFFLLEFLCWYSRQIHVCLLINTRI